MTAHLQTLTSEQAKVIRLRAIATGGPVALPHRLR